MNKKDLTNTVCSLAKDTEADVIVLNESGTPVAKTPSALQSGVDIKYTVPITSPGNRFHCFTRRSELELTEIQEAKAQDQNHILIIHAKHVLSNRTITLFSVVHRSGSPYPAKIQPPDLPHFLKNLITKRYSGIYESLDWQKDIK